MTSSSSHAHPFINAAELAVLRRDVMEQGFFVDPFVGVGLDRRVCGLNVTVAWPFPDDLRSRYEEIAARLGALDPDVYVYPFSATHITLLTIVSFKDHPSPTPEVERAIVEVAPRVVQFLRDALPAGPITVDIGTPVLARAAGFFPVRDDTGRLLALRTLLADFCQREGGPLVRPFAQPGLHSTVLRFRGPPASGAALLSAFDALAPAAAPGRATLDEALVTLETKPYMRAGEVLGRARL